MMYYITITKSASPKSVIGGLIKDELYKFQGVLVEESDMDKFEAHLNKLQDHYLGIGKKDRYHKVELAGYRLITFHEAGITMVFRKVKEQWQGE